MIHPVLEELYAAVQNGLLSETVELTRRALDEELEPNLILEQSLIPAMEVVGESFRKNEIFVPEMLIVARAMNRALELLEPFMEADRLDRRKTMVIGTVKGDLHDIGKNLVGIMFKGAGFKVIDLGTDVPVEKFIAAARKHNPDIIGISALLTTTMGYMQMVIEGLRSHGIETKTIVGGAPITPEFAQKINASGYAESAAVAVDLAKALLEQSSS